MEASEYPPLEGELVEPDENLVCRWCRRSLRMARVADGRKVAVDVEPGTGRLSAHILTCVAASPPRAH